MKVKCNIFRYAFAAVLFLTAVPASFAQTDADAVLKSLASAIKGLGNYTVSFRVTVEGSTAAGEYTVSGNRYHISMGDSEIFSDGKTLYDVNHFDEEIVIDNVDLTERNILSNPTRAFDFSDDSFRASYKGVMNEGGRQYDVVELQPRDGDSSIRNIELTVDKATKMPHSISYLADGISGFVVVEVVKIASAPKVPDSLFTPDMTLLRDYEPIDFR